MASQPNILYFQVDNLGCGELSCYTGGPFRGTWTPHIDEFARGGTRLTNFAPEAQCTPSRSALLTGRHAIRSGTHSVPIGAEAGWGLVRWERTLADALSEAGYACAAYGKWHVGEGPGRWPTDKGFDEWYGPPRTYDEALWPADPWYDPARDPVSRMLEIRKGQAAPDEREQLTLDVRRDCDAEYLKRTNDFITRCVDNGAPFFVYFNHSLMHMPVLPRKEFEGRTGNGPWADSLAELDADFAQLLALLEATGVRDNTIVVFAGDNGPEEVTAWRGSPGAWRGSYFAGGEGNLRTPCIVQWPGQIPSGQVSNDIMHITDWFTTLLGAAGVHVPTDRVIDGVDQRAWLTGEAAHSQREGYLYWMGAELYGVKWRDFKLVLVQQLHLSDPPQRLATPRVINLLTDPHEREAFALPHLHSWTASHFNRLMAEFAESVKREPLTPAGAPIGHVP
ncbi:sulfatase-like hydrolase/transferase [Pseudoxanthomonas indica]|uniref:Arylsulfatase n=1 Tax=Pseudoxanthomonas indica TaxID=428993 RepID=A0A1T5LUB9_9GAMM|nr:sulfatase-like hydrolase/transferase [Pseudoxanthomonas indica]GGD39441.1 sulfatase [Pseudoxanthomonas indica]SKC79415.1 arylsulfatase [Pseudoxanthomonas indica]